MSDLAIEHAERIAALETMVKGLEDTYRRDTDEMKATIKDLSTKIDSLLAIVQQARGARWALLGLGAIGGALVSAATGLAGKLGGVLGLVAK